MSDACEPINKFESEEFCRKKHIEQYNGLKR